MPSLGWLSGVARAMGGGEGSPRTSLTRVLLALCISSVAAAAPPAALRREPERYALVVGNGGYNTYGTMGDLLTACDEAVQFRKRLISLGWTRGHIYPLVEVSTGGETDADVRKAVCDLKTDRLASELRNFANLLIGADSNPYGVVYYAGHGAQSDGNQYIFGVDADIDFQAELARAVMAPNYKVFADSGVDLISIVSRVSRTEGRAMLVIIDACRDNPVLNKYRDDLQRARVATRNPALVERLSAGYLSRDGQYSDLTDDFNNIIVLFSTRPRREAAGASPGQTTQFSRFVLDQLQNGMAIQGNVPGFVDGVISEARTKQVGLPTFDRQIPDRLGSMSTTPVFCFKGCPQPLDVWPSTRINIITGSATSFSAPRGTGWAAREARRSPLLHNAAYLVGAGQSGGADADEPARALVALPPRSIKVDVFYCQGDALAAKREADATAYARALYAAYPPSRLIGRYYIDPVRTVSFDPAAKPVIATGKFGNTIWIDADSPLEHEWAARFAELGSGIRIVENRWTKSKEYMSVFFCEDRAENATPVSAIYTQVSRRADIPKAQALISGLKGEIAGLNFVTTVDAVDEKDPTTTRTPTHSEVRYYRDDQRSSARAIAGVLGQRLAFPITVKKVQLGRASRNPVIEVWIGLTETNRWHGAGS